ncbi:MAG: Uma2 family endonuclease, partial [Alphaproteobacteria bacterium]
MAGESRASSSESGQPLDQVGFRLWIDSRPDDDPSRYEFLGGEVVMSPPARSGHGLVGHRLNLLVGRHVADGDLGACFDASTGFELPTGDTLAPDFAFVSRPRWDAAPKPAPDEFVRVVPDLVEEVLSPSTAKRDREEKRRAYAASGVGEYWLVDPSKREVRVIDLAESPTGSERIVRSGAIVSRVLPSLEVAVEDL